MRYEGSGLTYAYKTLRLSSGLGTLRFSSGLGTLRLSCGLGTPPYFGRALLSLALFGLIIITSFFLTNI